MRWLIVALIIISSGSVDAATRSPFFVEVKEGVIILTPESEHYFDVFADDEKREIATKNIAESEDFRKLLEYVTSHVAKSGLLRRKRDTIINFLVRPDGVETYRAAKQVVDKFEEENMNRLAINVLPNGDPLVQLLSTKTPYLGGRFDDKDFSEPKEFPRDPKTGYPLLQSKVVLVRNGKVISFIYTDKQMETSLKDKVRRIIDRNNIKIEEGRYITDEKQAIKIIDEFNNEQVGNIHFQVELARRGRFINFMLTPTDVCGEKPEQAVGGFFARSLRSSNRKYCLRYLVEPNSFEAYRAIRKYTDGRGFHAFWTIIEPGSYTHSVGGGYYVGEKPRPVPYRPPPSRPPRPVKGALD